MFLLSLYKDDLGLRSACSFSSKSDDFRFDMDLEMDVHVKGEADYPMMLPLLLPSSSNVNLETDVPNGLEEPRSRASMQPTSDNLWPSPSSMLRSKWSSSTIVSIREEHRLYFGGKRGSKDSNVPQTPKSLNLTSYTMKYPRRYYGHGRHSRRESDVIIIGYGRGNGVRRRGNIMRMTSDAGSDDSASRRTNSGLRRKPICGDVFEGWGLSWALSVSFLFDIFHFILACLIVFVAKLRSQTSFLMTLPS